MSQPSRGALASYGKDVEVIFLRFWPNGTSQTTLTRVDDAADATAGGFMDSGGGVASVQRTATAGKFTVTLEKGYTRFFGAFPCPQLGTPANLSVQCGTVTAEGTPATAMSFPVSLWSTAATTAVADIIGFDDDSAGTADTVDYSVGPFANIAGADAAAIVTDVNTNLLPAVRNAVASIAHWAGTVVTKINAMTSADDFVETDVSASVNNSVGLLIVVGKSKVPR